MLHAGQKEFKAYKVYGYDPETHTLFSPFYKPARKDIVNAGVVSSNRILGLANQCYDGDLKMKLRGKTSFRIDKGIHIILNEEDTVDYEVFQYCITVPIFVDPLDLVSIDDCGRYAVCMKIVIKQDDYDKALLYGKKKMETFEINLERMKMI